MKYYWYGTRSPSLRLNIVWKSPQIDTRLSKQTIQTVAGVFVQADISAIHKMGPGNTESENLWPVSIPRMPVEHYSPF